MTKKLLVAVLALIAICAISAVVFAGSTGPISVWYDDFCRLNLGQYELMGTVTNNSSIAFHIDEVYVEGPGEFWMGLPIPVGILEPGQTTSVKSIFVGNSPTGWYRLNVKGVFVGSTQQTTAHWSAHVSGHCGGNTPTHTPTDTLTATPTLTITPTGTITETPVITPTEVTPTATTEIHTPQPTEDPVLACQFIDKPAGIFQLDWQDGSGQWQFGAMLDGGDGEGGLVLSQDSAPNGGIFRILKDGVVLAIFTIQNGECTISNDEVKPVSVSVKNCTDEACREAFCEWLGEVPSIWVRGANNTGPLFSRNEFKDWDVIVEGYYVDFQITLDEVLALQLTGLILTDTQCSICSAAPLGVKVDGEWFGLYIKDLSNVWNLREDFISQGIEPTTALLWALSVAGQYNDPSNGNYESRYYRVSGPIGE